MTRIKAGAVALEYEEFGSPDAPPMLLIMGLGGQLIDWPVAFCQGLVAEGFRVIRYDHRDTGLSDGLDGDGAPDLAAVTAGTAEVPYGLSDLAADAVGLLDALGIRSAHVVGGSMGGMIAQLLAAQYSDRVRSLVSIMSTTGSPTVGRSAPELVAALTASSVGGREAVIEQAVSMFRSIGSAGVPEEEIRAVVAARYDRAHRPDGVARQLAAVVTAGDRTTMLAEVTAPAMVIHGEADRLVDISGGRATARAIPGAEFVSIPGMAHDLPKVAWPRIIAAIAATARRAGL
ncbi:alpha/beta fold hydrolase [Pseudonocardia spinosispora]|uniref:alpha/beta fold hydrolase n=1 Tax=Pseudonocardia spinosispora TaxID=103441 RepID=UPI0004142ABC|nr:alpha/beta hydrolase [Pseudonocardia spinosispora]